MEFNFKIKGDKLISGGILDGNSGCSNVYSCNFEIPDNSDYTWICVFKSGDLAYQKAIENGRCLIPSEVLDKKGVVRIGCYGLLGEKRISTNWLEFTVEEGAYCEAAMPKEPENDLWETLVLNACPYIGENGNWYVYDKASGDYKDSGKTARGEQGPVGETGQAGYTPQRGVDYWTDADKNEVADSLEEKLNFEQRLGRITKNTGNTLKGYKEGNTVTIRDISPIDHTIEAKLCSKNLINIASPAAMESALAVAEENKLLITPTNTDTVLSSVYFEIGEYSDFINESLTVSVNNESEKPWVIHICGLDENNSIVSGSEILTENLGGNGYVSKAFVVPEKYNIKKLALQIQSESDIAADGETYTLSGIQVEKGTYATEYEPYLSGEKVAIRQYGANILNIENPKKLVNCGVTAEGNSICIKKTHNGTGYINIYYSLGEYSKFVGKTMTLSAKNKSLAGWVFYIGGLTGEDTWINPTDVSKYGKNFVAGLKNTLVFTVPEIEDAVMLGLRICSDSNSTAIGEEFVLSDIQVSFGDTKPEYAPYTEPLEFSINTDGTVCEIPSIYPVTTLVSDSSGAVIECKYNRDINKAFSEMIEKLTNAIISLGGNV